MDALTHFQKQKDNLLLKTEKYVSPLASSFPNTRREGEIVE